MEKKIQIKQPKYQVIAEDIAAKIVEKNMLSGKRFMPVHRWHLNTVFHRKLLDEQLPFYRI